MKKCKEHRGSPAQVCIKCGLDFLKYIKELEQENKRLKKSLAKYKERETEK